MTRSLFISTAAAAALALAGCDSSQPDVAPGLKQTPHYEYKVSGHTLVVVPVASDLVDLSKPVTNVSDGNVAINGQIRLRTGVMNPAAVVRIVVVDRNGNEIDEIHASLKESDTPNTFTYRARFAPVPPTGSSLTIAYEDWHPNTDYSAANIGSGGNNAAKNDSSAAGAGAPKGGTSKTQTYGGTARLGSGTTGVRSGHF